MKTVLRTGISLTLSFVGLSSRGHRYGNGKTYYNVMAYDDHGRVVRFGISKHRSEYSYDIRNRQTSHTSPSFSQTLEYESPSIEGAQARYDGSLSAIKETRYVDSIPEWHYRKIYYDQSGQITEIDDSDSLRMNESYEYDLNGNITRIRRGAPEALYDDVYLGYAGNQLTYVVDDVDYDSYLGEIPQYNSSSLLDTLTYDSKGRLLSDRSQGIWEISYYPNDLPREILMTNSERLVNTYHSDGSKHSDYRRIRYMKTVMQIDANGDTVYVEQPAYKTICRYYIGNSVREDNSPTRFYTEDGYFNVYRGVATFHYYVRDYLGSIRAIVNYDGEVEQTVDYLSTGIPIKGGTGEIIDDRLHTGKQYLSMNGTLLYDNVARYYSPVHGRFITPDALSGDYPHISHYAHCANNPLSIIDPTGMDIWRLNNHGYVVDVELTTEYDKLEMIDDEEKSITFEHGTIISQKSYNYEDGKTYDVWKVRGDENATQMFEFMSDNITGSDSKVEIGLAQTGIAGDKGLNFITTGHIENREPGFSNLWYNQLGYLYNIRTHVHSHPSGTNPSGGDIQFVKGVINHLNDNKPLFNNKWYMAMPKFRIYHVPSKKYINYNQNGVIK